MTMSSRVCQGLQSCLEPRLVESSILMHNLSPPNSNIFHSLSFLEKKDLGQEQEDASKKNGGSSSGGWSFIQTLCNTSQSSKQGFVETEQVYVHPLVKRNSSSLSPRSLEMCTESLGSETGSDNNDEFASLLVETHNAGRSESRGLTRKASRAAANKFPPPLPSISGSDGVQVRPHREGGRLVLKAVPIPSFNPHFQAERADGRLRLSFLNREISGGDCSTQGNEEEEELSGISEESAGVVVDDDDDNGGLESLEDDMKRNNDDGDDDDDGKVGCEIEVGDYARPSSRCKEGGNRNRAMTNWATFWVAIS